MLISITGPECSGKTTLGRFLARELSVDHVEEYAREYLGTTNGKYSFEDIDAIAKHQVNLVCRAGKRKTESENLHGNSLNCSGLTETTPILDLENSKAKTGEANGAEFEEVERVVITDTFLLVILIWSWHKFGKVSENVRTLYSKFQPDLYLLCRPDLAWEYDALRESKHEREELFEIYLEHIRSTNIPFLIVEGTAQNRRRGALHFVQSLIQKKLP